MRTGFAPTSACPQTLVFGAMATFPTVIDEVTTQWLTESLRSSGVLAADSQVRGFDVEPIGMGVGIMGLLYRLSLRYDSEGAGPATSVLKLASVDPQARHMAQVFRFYEKEVGFYRQFAELTPIPTTACYAARPRSGNRRFRTSL